MKNSEVLLLVMSSGDYWLGRYQELNNINLFMEEFNLFIRESPKNNWDLTKTIFG